MHCALWGTEGFPFHQPGRVSEVRQQGGGQAMRRRWSGFRVFLVLALAVPAVLVPALADDVGAKPIPIPDPGGRLGGSGGDGADPDVFDVNAPVIQDGPDAGAGLVREAAVAGPGRGGRLDGLILHLRWIGIRQLMTRI